MNLLIKSATILDPGSSFHQRVADILIENGVITRIADDIDADTELFDAEGKYVSPGFFDLNCNVGELGLETKEDLHSGTMAAAAGGFTGIALMPNTQPPVHSKSEVEYLLNRSKGNLVDVYPLGTISQKREGKDLAEMYDMYQSGAKAFTDGNRPVQDAGLMERALLYAQGFDALVFSYPEDTAIAGKAKVNEGEISTLLGMKGIPSLAEELMVARDLYLAEYTVSRIHFTTISTARSVELIREAKRKGIEVTCDVAAHHLILTDEALLGFDSLYKVKPPLRTADDVAALVKGLKDGTIDAIVSQHTPHEIEFKDVEFEVAEYGIIGLQTAFSLALKAGLPVELIVEKLAVNPREILGVELPVIAEDEKANLVVFDTDAEWEYTAANNKSKSANSPYIGQRLKGKVLLTYNNQQIFK
ncbi:dihydroorotase [Mucilaginibacter rubeus]|uniref:Dihydroorotase n=1 Tax=Mucilaginibacter rubeus TaxID=2027860 RepID=A0AAE6JEM2_9SPHI|nr:MULTISPECIES: dihydroorotase [Mucilaginibacter]QEM03878.1 dihydroorotase [Mucilaginibacter rubeus]QEM16488.1 dihydroorotase [Mucilaginibacter gossypii]QTE40744.1 dihydroorotase [Mucilaginibacter rubeus]QTE47346.1 dihydroorotase [Mucilaginibacter rubeus]QTE58739.1 dihydroorotase [Mucilaginibacter rubeus]